MSDLQQKQTGPSQTNETARPAATPAPAVSAEIDLMELMYRLLAHWKLIVCLALIFAIATGVYTTYTTTPMYRATSVIYIVSRDSAVNLSDLQLGSVLTQDYIKIFNMWEIHAEVISRLNLPYSYGAIRGMVSVQNTSGTHMLDITVTSPNPVEAAAIANEYAEVASQYIADTMAKDKPNIMSVALVPSNPISTNRSQKIMTAFMVGALLAAGLVFLQMLLDDKYKTAEDIRKYTGLATLAVIPVDEALGGKTSKEKGGR